MMRRLIPLLLLMAGGAQALSLAWPDGPARGQAYGVLQLLSLGILAACVDRAATPEKAARDTAIFATAWLAGSTWWLYISLHTYGGMNPVLAAAAVLLLSMALSLIYSGFVWLHRQTIAYQAPLIARVAGFAAAWTLAELLRGFIATGFPWGAIGYAHTDSWLAAWVPWLGVYGVGAIAAALSMWIGARKVDNIKPSRLSLYATGAVALALLVLAIQTPASGTNTDTTLRVALVQGNVPQNLKFSEDAKAALMDYHSAMLHTPADLVVTPETAVPYLPEQIPAAFWKPLRDTSTHAVLMGLPLRAKPHGPAAYTNSVLGIAPAQTEDYRYDKHHLVPFGEFVPPLFQWFVDRMHIPLGDFAKGALAQAPFEWKGQRISVNICFEDLFGEELAQSFTHPDRAPTLLLNVSNLAWFGNTVALDQHLNIARMRAMELGRPMLRATNTGATAVIDAQGQVQHKLDYETKGVLIADVRGISGPSTPYVRWVAQWGLWPLAGAMCLLWGIAAQMSRNSRHGQRRFGG